jgi:hypothetical protein
MLKKNLQKKLGSPKKRSYLWGVGKEAQKQNKTNGVDD